MIDATLERIEETILTTGIEQAKKNELVGLIGQLRNEITGLADTHTDHAQSIAGFAQISAHEATREKPDQELLQIGLDGLSQSVREFEVSHPKLVNVVNVMHRMLTNIGLG